MGAWTTSSDSLTNPCHGDGLRVFTRWKDDGLLQEVVFYYVAGVFEWHSEDTDVVLTDVGVDRLKRSLAKALPTPPPCPPPPAPQGQLALVQPSEEVPRSPWWGARGVGPTGCRGNKGENETHDKLETSSNMCLLRHWEPCVWGEHRK